MQGIIQIAGVVDEAEAMMLVEVGVHQIGFPLGLPVHKEDISAEDAANIVRLLKPPAHPGLILCGWKNLLVRLPSTNTNWWDLGARCC